MPILATLSGAIELARKLANATAALKDAQTRLEMVELLNQLVEVRIECVALTEENAELRRQLAAEADPPQVRDGLYYRGADGPFCVGCWDGARKTVRLTLPPAGKKFSLGHRCVCPVCKTGY